MYLATFDNQGNRITSYVVGMHKDIPADAVQISDEDQALYATNEYIRVDGKPVKRPVYVPTIQELQVAKLAELDQAAATAYEAGFYSAATGTELCYDSDVETQKLLNGMYARTLESDWGTKVRYPGAAPAGKAPIRARPTKEAAVTEKEVQLLDAGELKTLIDDLDSYLYSVKLVLWQKQAALKAATTVAEVTAITWPV
ncbi:MULTISPECIES: hypothetical protein [Pelosinus]|uniref:DUF4376 domain-containing protein n=1 Tax=Pelosinus fermentans B4 TaxID=1149862 RepID=I8RM90_9FIRM|nr:MULTISPECIES: hypothetical protein [Pelosinus]EIW19900.1 hypothetical protein FB4_0151 [Pelosinus fermentans B4]EIW21243.1 hypothetical protein FA11_0970 [Pelosinus fermentans A11]